MRLKPKERILHEPATRVLTPEAEVDLVLFDPLKELPITELAGLALLPKSDLSYEQKIRVMSSAWLGILDTQHREALRRSPWLKQFWEAHCYQYLPAAGLKPDFSSSKAICLRLAHFFQIFPEERANIRLTPDHLYTLLGEFNGSDLGEQLHLGVCLSQVFPDEQALIAKRIYRRHFTPEDYGKSALYYLPGKVDLDFVSDTLSLDAFLWRMADLLILFPEERDRYESLIQKLSQELRHQCLEVSPKASLDLPKDATYFHRLYSLTILAAHDARILTDGRLQITLKPHLTIKNVPLPPRTHF